MYADTHRETYQQVRVVLYTSLKHYAHVGLAGIDHTDSHVCSMARGVSFRVVPVVHHKPPPPIIGETSYLNM